MDILNLAICPVKSTRMHNCRELVIGERGFNYDRLFGVADRLTHKIITQRELGELAQIQTILIQHDYTIVACEGDQFLLPNYGNASIGEYTIFKDEVELDILLPATKWLRSHFDDDFQIVRFGKVSKRSDKRMAADSGTNVKLQDGSQVLVINRSSLQYMNARLEMPVVPEAFRANIMVDGGVEAFAEDEWKVLQVAGKDIRLHRVGPCFRCEITCNDPVTGMRLGKEPLRWLGFNRRTQFTYPDGKSRSGAAFGVYYRIEAAAGSVITERDKLVVLEYAAAT